MLGRIVLFLSGNFINSFCDEPVGENFDLKSGKMNTLIVRKVRNFEINGEGTHENLAILRWIELPQRKSTGESLGTKVKILYSKTGLYFLFHCQDNRDYINPG